MFSKLTSKSNSGTQNKARFEYLLPKSCGGCFIPWSKDLLPTGGAGGAVLSSPWLWLLEATPCRPGVGGFGECGLEFSAA